MKLEEWKQQILKQYPRNSQIVPASSMAARGARKVGREELGRHTSPKGGSYVVFGPTTHAQRYSK